MRVAASARSGLRRHGDGRAAAWRVLGGAAGLALLAAPVALRALPAGPAAAAPLTVARPATTGGGAATELAGYSASLQAVGAQFAFNIPTLVPVSGNLVEDDLPFARTTVGNGPNIDALAAPYYPGDILGHLGSLISEFAPPSAPSFPNDPADAEAQYPPSPGHGASTSFGVNPPAGAPASPQVASGQAEAGPDGSTTAAALTNLTVGTGPTPALQVASVTATNTFGFGATTVTGDATTTVKGIEIAGTVDISQLTSAAQAESDGTTGTPTTSVQVGPVTVAGQPAYIDQQGVHVGTVGTPPSASMRALQQSLDATLAQDGIGVRMLDPLDTATGAQGQADAGGLVVTITHNFNVRYVPGEPTVPLPALGNQGLPAGNYTAVTSITLGDATAEVSAAPAPPTAATATTPVAPASTPPPDDSTLGVSLPSLADELGGNFQPDTAAASTPTTPAPAGATAAVGPTSITGQLLQFRPFGLPTPLSWVIGGALLCLLFTYPMLLTARWQFLGRRRR